MQLACFELAHDLSDFGWLFHFLALFLAVRSPRLGIGFGLPTAIMIAIGTSFLGLVGFMLRSPVQ